MRIKTSQDGSMEETDCVVIYIGRVRFTITDSKKGALRISKAFSDPGVRPIQITTKAQDVIEIK